ncbi:MAG: tetratricopeptide repeat protein, partial [Ilumatobacteraceae bacterium]
QLGTRYASYHFHAGMIQLALGNDDEARAELTMALDINPTFDPLDVPIATDALAGLGDGA